MTQLGGRQWAQVWTAVSAALVAAGPGEQHLATEAVVAYVDGELSLTAHERATRHLAECPMCTAEVAAQRQARAAVRSASAPAMPASLLAALHAIPQSAELPPVPGELSIGEDGQFVMAQRPLTSEPPLGMSAPLGSGRRLGSGAALGSGGLDPGASDPAAPARSRNTRRVRNGAGVVVSGLVLGALALAAPSEPAIPGAPLPGTEPGQPVTAVPAWFDLRTPEPLEPAESPRPSDLQDRAPADLAPTPALAQR